MNLSFCLSGKSKTIYTEATTIFASRKPKLYQSYSSLFICTRHDAITSIFRNQQVPCTSQNLTHRIYTISDDNVRFFFYQNSRLLLWHISFNNQLKEPAKKIKIPAFTRHWALYYIAAGNKTPRISRVGIINFVASDARKDFFFFFETHTHGREKDRPRA